MRLRDCTTEEHGLRPALAVLPVLGLLLLVAAGACVPTSRAAAESLREIAK